MIEPTADIAEIPVQNRELHIYDPAIDTLSVHSPDTAGVIYIPGHEEALLPHIELKGAHIPLAQLLAELYRNVTYQTGGDITLDASLPNGAILDKARYGQVTFGVDQAYSLDNILSLAGKARERQIPLSSDRLTHFISAYLAYEPDIASKLTGSIWERMDEAQRQLLTELAEKNARRQETAANLSTEAKTIKDTIDSTDTINFEAISKSISAFSSVMSEPEREYLYWYLDGKMAKQARQAAQEGKLTTATIPGFIKSHPEFKGSDEFLKSTVAYEEVRRQIDQHLLGKISPIISQLLRSDQKKGLLNSTYTIFKKGGIESWQFDPEKVDQLSRDELSQLLMQMVYASLGYQYVEKGLKLTAPPLSPQKEVAVAYPEITITPDGECHIIDLFKIDPTPRLIKVNLGSNPDSSCYYHHQGMPKEAERYFSFYTHEHPQIKQERTSSLDNIAVLAAGFNQGGIRFPLIFQGQYSNSEVSLSVVDNPHVRTILTIFHNVWLLDYEPGKIELEGKGTLHKM